MISKTVGNGLCSLIATLPVSSIVLISTRIVFLDAEKSIHGRIKRERQRERENLKVFSKLVGLDR